MHGPRRRVSRLCWGVWASSEGVPAVMGGEIGGSLQNGHWNESRLEVSCQFSSLLSFSTLYHGTSQTSWSGTRSLHLARLISLGNPSFLF